MEMAFATKRKFGNELFLTGCEGWREDGFMRNLLLLLILGGTTCTGGAQTPATPEAAPWNPAAQRATKAPSRAPGGAPGPGKTLEQIRALIGTAPCNHSNQCRTLPIGARPCGGPEAYLAWSTVNASEFELRALAERYKAERDAHNRASGMISDCRYIADPGAVCRAGTCQLGSGGPEIR
jgi:hypothetical protein